MDDLHLATDPVVADKAGRVLSAANVAKMRKALAELQAMMAAAGVDTTAVKELADKCCGDSMDMAMPESPYGGATSFADAEAYQAATQSAEMKSEILSDLNEQFQTIVANIWADDMMDLTQKSAAISSAAAELESRVNAAAAMKAFDASVGGGVDRSKIPAEDFAGPHQSYPIVTPKDVADAASLVGKAADSGAVKSRIISIAKRKGPSFVSRLPADWNVKSDGFIASIKGLFTKRPQFVDATDPADDPDNAEKATTTAVPMTIFKDLSGKYRYVAVATNSYRDKENESFSPESHQDYVDWVDRTKEYPELWLWHTPGTRLGQADQIYFDADTGFRVSTGTFDEGLDDVAERLANMPGLAMSHGYLFRKDHLVDGVYHRYRDFEETLLPSIDVAASDATAFIATREEAMSVPTVKRDFFEKVLGRDRYAKIEASLGERAATMTDEEFVTAFKAVMDETETKDMATMTPAERKAAMSKMTPEEKAAAMAAMGKSIDDEGNIVEKVEEPKDDEKALAGMKAVVLEGMKEALTPIQTSLKELTDWKATVDAKIIALEKSEDERIASMFGIRGLQPGAITAPVDSDDNLIDGRAMRALKSALGGAKDEVKSPVAPMVEMLMADLARGVSA